ncbi:hypothetical protein ACFL5K_02770 [Gemmatimonadota bacterium]
MLKQVARFLLIIVLLLLFFWLLKSRWLNIEKKKEGGNNRSVEQVEDHLESWVGDMDALLSDSADLKDFLDYLAEGDLEVRLRQWTDSVMVIERRLEAYRELMVALRDRLRAEGWNDSSELHQPYFPAVKGLRGLEARSRGLSTSLDTLSTLIKAFQEAAGRNGKPARVVGDSVKPEEAHWLIPSKVPVSQACLSCHPLTEGGQVVLFPGVETEDYPQIMQQHPPHEFGCISCHRGEPEALDFDRAHGPDATGLPFLTRRLTLRSCGFCHSRDVLPKNTAALFPWPENCRVCHDPQRTAGNFVDSSRMAVSLEDSVLEAFADSLGNSRELRAWMLEHWCEKSGIYPVREQFEQTLSLLAVARVDSNSEEPDSSEAVVGMTACRCPSCGRVFEVLPDIANPVCPVDGTVLMPLKVE